MMTLFDEAKSAYIAKRRRDEEAERVTRDAWHKFNEEWAGYAFDHAPFPMDGAWIDEFGEEPSIIHLEDREFSISVFLPWGVGPISPDKAIARGMDVSINWHIRGTCPDCSKEVWSREFSDLAGLGEQLVKFEPGYSHREWDCKPDE